MKVIRKTLLRLKTLFLNGKTETELDNEMQFHLEMEVKKNLNRGMSPKEAKQSALQEFGGIEQAKEECRDAWGIRVLMNLLRDIRVIVHSLRKSPGFSLAVIITLTLCIGVNTTILSTLYGLILKPLPVENPDRIVKVFNVGRNGAHGKMPSLSDWSQYLDFKEQADLFEGFAVRLPSKKIINRGSFGISVKGQSISADFFDLMGVRPLLGRFFSLEEVDPGPGYVVVLTQTYWENEYNADPNVIGTQISFNDSVLYTIIGVAPRSMEIFDYEAKFFIPYEFQKNSRDPQLRYSDGSDLWARLKENVSREAGLEQLRAIERRWYEEVANATGRSHASQIKRLELGLPHPLKGPLSLLEAGALFVFFVGCLNITNLLMGRAGQKCHELSIRNSLGSGKFALRRLMLIESFLLMAVAIAGGIILASVGLHVINRYLSIFDPSAMPITLNTTVLISILAASGGVALFMGVLPLELLWKAGLIQRIDSSKRTSSAGGLAKKLSNSLVIGQIAITFILLIGASLLFRSFQNVLAVDPGFDAARIVKGNFEYENVLSLYRRSETIQLKQRIMTAMKEIPGVQNVGLSLFDIVVPHHNKTKQDFIIRGIPRDPSQEMIGNTVSPEYFDTIGIPILEGRNFNQGDGFDSVIIDELFARRYFKSHSAVGAEIYPGNQPPSGRPWKRIIGVAKRANLQGLEQRDGLPCIYYFMDNRKQSPLFTMLLRTSRSPEDVIKDVWIKLREIDPRLPLGKVETLQDSIDNMLLDRKGMTLLLASFAGLALLLSVVGIYAVLAFDILQRRREIGIRVAIGSSKKQVLRLILKESLMKASVGLVLGLGGAFALSHYLSSLLFDITPLDPITYIIVSSILFAGALIASYLPAHKAANYDPLKALVIE